MFKKNSQLTLINKLDTEIEAFLLFKKILFKI